MGIYLDPGADNSFTELTLDDRGIYVDKTGFIAEICARLDQPDRMLLLALPRRFGKTVTAQMLLIGISYRPATREHQCVIEQIK